eukprot:5977904-Pleurochrysis_carterae.AAC.1
MLTQKRLRAAEIAGDRDPTAELRAATLRGRASRCSRCRCDATLVLHRVGLGGSKKKGGFAGCGCGRA